MVFSRLEGEGRSSKPMVLALGKALGSMVWAEGLCSSPAICWSCESFARASPGHLPQDQGHPADWANEKQEGERAEEQSSEVASWKCLLITLAASRWAGLSDKDLGPTG